MTSIHEDDFHTEGLPKVYWKLRKWKDQKRDSVLKEEKENTGTHNRALFPKPHTSNPIKESRRLGFVKIEKFCESKQENDSIAAATALSELANTSALQQNATKRKCIIKVSKLSNESLVRPNFQKSTVYTF